MLDFSDHMRTGISILTSAVETEDLLFADFPLCLGGRGFKYGKSKSSFIPFQVSTL